MGLDESCDYGPCVKDDGYDCAYKTRMMDYKIEAEGTTHELVMIDPFAERRYIKELQSKSKIVDLQWRPCHYFHQKWMGARATHTVYNYRYFLSDIFYAGSAQKRNLLVLDEAHQLESEVEVDRDGEPVEEPVPAARAAARPVQHRDEVDAGR